MSNRVSVVCTQLTIEAGGSIDANGLGYGCIVTTTPKTGSGPSPGLSTATRGSGAGHGGRGGSSTERSGGAIFGDPDNAVWPGSSSAGRDGPGSGGGAILIQADRVTVNGAIQANGQSGSGTYGGGGAGGAISITCSTLTGSGAISASGGNGSHVQDGGGGGGRIAIHCPNLSPELGITFSAAGGVRAYSEPAQMGTLSLPNRSLLTNSLSRFRDVRLVIPGFVSWTVPGLTVTGGGVSFNDGAFDLTVNGDLVCSNSGRLYLGGRAVQGGWSLGHPETGTNPLVRVTGRVMLDDGSLTVGGWRQTPKTVLEIDGDLVLTNSGSLYVFAGETNAATDQGAWVRVTGETRIGHTNSWINPYSNPTNTGGSVLFELGDVAITAGGFNADRKGYGWIGSHPDSIYGPLCYGEGVGPTVSSRGGGGSYGGLGGPVKGFVGKVYGVTNAPTLPGSPGGLGSPYPECGGGLIRIDAANLFLDGYLTANAGAGNRNGGSSGGGIFVRCSAFAGSGVLRANGSAGSNITMPSGGGAGGRIAVWIGVPESDWARVMAGDVSGILIAEGYSGFDGLTEVKGETGYVAVDKIPTPTSPGEPGTVVFLTPLPDIGTLLIVR